MGKPQVFKLPKQQTPPPLLRIEPFKGINLSVTPTQIDVHQSPEMLNMQIDQRGSLNKRTGYERVFATSLGVGSINGMFDYKKKDGAVEFLFAHGTKLYKLSDTNQPVQVTSPNLLPPFTEWTLHANAKVISPYELELVATGSNQISSFKVSVLSKQTYSIKAKIEGDSNTRVYVRRDSVSGATLTTLLVGTEQSSFTIPVDVTDIHIIFMTIGSSGTHRLINPQFEKGNTSTAFNPKGLALSDNEVNFFVMNDKCYIMDGINYLVYDGTTVSQIVPYVPHLTISGKPGTLATGTLREDFNLLGAGFKETFSGDGIGTVFQLSLKGLDATTLTAKVDEVAKVEGTHFTVDRTLGRITFTTAPTTGTNNVEIVAYKTQADFPNRIKKCTFNVLFGGSNDTRVFLGGNPDYGNQIWRLGLQDPTYAPENGFYKVGSDSEKVQGFSKQYDYLVIEKERSKWLMHYEIQGGEPTFPLKPINDQVGTFARGTIQTVENNPVSLDRTGVYMLMASTVRDERNVQHVSENVDARLLAEPNLEKAVSVDYDRKYWLAVNGNVYVYDYSIGEWYLFDNINARQFYEMNGDLFFGSSTDGLIYRFKKATVLYPYNDDNQAITAYWLSKVMSFEADEQLKLVEKVFFSLNPATRTSADLYYLSNKKNRKFVKTTRKDLFHYSFLDYGLWSYGSREYPQEASNKVKAKKIVYFQMELRNEQMDEPLGLLSLGVKFIYQRMVK